MSEDDTDAEFIPVPDRVVTVDEDPHRPLRPVVCGVVPDDGTGWVYAEGVILEAAPCERNMWDLKINDVRVVTFDADAFPTTADLGLYIEGVIENMTADPNSEDADTDADLTELGTGATRGFQ